MVGGGPGEEVAESGLAWLVISAGVVDDCGCECGVVDTFSPVLQGVVNEDQEIERTDLGSLGHPARRRQEGGRGALQAHGLWAPREEIGSCHYVPSEPQTAALLMTVLWSSRRGRGSRGLPS